MLRANLLRQVFALRLRRRIHLCLRYLVEAQLPGPYLSRQLDVRVLGRDGSLLSRVLLHAFVTSLIVMSPPAPEPSTCERSMPSSSALRLAALVALGPTSSTAPSAWPAAWSTAPVAWSATCPARSVAFVPVSPTRFVTSLTVTSPPEPVPSTCERSMPSSSALRLAASEAFRSCPAPSSPVAPSPSA